ncbi:hypothetical protein OSC52_00995 [Clostridium pasteurianum]|uniref:hypothetical protein n=1 Tax=Clostridium pasteurianum TaxID=1501 RepID=UPI0022608E8F|nr:hypothetical protein [Clostridium pasteurianum]UZW14452.1 hypothetical protein OSC52_00995 [Clostridium pasteurianum]
MKKIFFTLLSALMIFCAIYIIYVSPYTIIDNKKQLEVNVKNFINKSTVFVENIQIIQELNLDNKKLILFLTNDNLLGDGELTKGINNKYKIEEVGYSNNQFMNHVIKTDKKSYVILEGKNYNNKITYAKVLLDGNQYKVNIPQQSYFIVYCEIPSVKTKITRISMDNIKLYDKKNIDITNEMFKIFFN